MKKYLFVFAMFVFASGCQTTKTSAVSVTPASEAKIRDASPTASASEPSTPPTSRQTNKTRAKEIQAELKREEMMAELNNEAKRIAIEKGRPSTPDRGMVNEFVAQVTKKIRENIIEPPSSNGLKSTFKVIQLPTGEVISVELTSSSENVKFDDAVKRAIYKSSPLPLVEGRILSPTIMVTYVGTSK